MSCPLILLVEDSPDTTLIVRRYCRRGGQEVAACATVAEAWDWLGGERRPDLVLLDVNLPGESGLALFPRLRTVPAFAELPVAIFGHWGRPEELAAGIEAGADFLVSKDLLTRPEDWVARLEEILSPADRRPDPVSLSWQEPGVLPLPYAFLEVLNQVLRPPAGSLDGAVARAVLRRAARKVGRRAGLAADVPNGWLGPQGLLPDAVARAGQPELVGALVVALADQLWCLLGTAASAPCRDALTAAVLALTGTQPRLMKSIHAILLVEDNPADVKITQRALRESASVAELIVVRDGQEAIDYLLRQGAFAGQGPWRCPDLILLDLNLPRLNGREVLERIRATPALRSVPVVVLTTSRRAEDVQEVYAAGANTYVEKPRDFQRFVEILQTIQRYWLDTALLPPRDDNLTG
jgi:two-component system response regulator